MQDSEVRKAFQRSLTKQGFKFKLNTKVNGATIKGDKVTLDLETKKGEKDTLEADVVLVCAGIALKFVLVIHLNSRKTMHIIFCLSSFEYRPSAYSPHYFVCIVLVACLCSTVCPSSLLPRSAHTPHVTLYIMVKAVMHHGLLLKLRQMSGMWCMLTARCCAFCQPGHSAASIPPCSNMSRLVSSRNTSIAIRVVHCSAEVPCCAQNSATQICFMAQTGNNSLG